MTDDPTARVRAECQRLVGASDSEWTGPMADLGRLVLTALDAKDAEIAQLRAEVNAYHQRHHAAMEVQGNMADEIAHLKRMLKAARHDMGTLTPADIGMVPLRRDPVSGFMLWCERTMTDTEDTPHDR